MSDTDPRAEDPQVIVGISFDDTYRAQEFLTAATRLAAHGEMVLRDAVVISKDAEGRIQVKETTDPTPGPAALSGGMWGGLIGLIVGGPIGWVAGAAVGAGAGAAAAKAIDIGLPDEWVDWFKQAVQTDTVTVALLVDDIDADALVAEAQRFTGARLVYANLDPGTIGRIEGALAGVQAAEAPSDVPPTP
jgi:uncharacterized membrane protein